MASRHLARSIVMQTLYEWDFQGGLDHPNTVQDHAHVQAILERDINEFGPGLEDKTFARSLIDNVLDHHKDLDTIIEKAAPEWPINQIAIVDRNILRVGLCELLFGKHKEVPPKVAINEAIELAKTFGGVNSSKFINGVLGTVYREIGEPGKMDRPKKDLTPEERAKLLVEDKVGAVVFQKTDQGNMFALVHDVFGYWTLAKGSPLADEKLEDAVMRKVTDETGLGHLTVIQKMGENEYIAHDPEKGKVRRRVTYFLVDTTDTKLTLKSSGGLDDVRWFAEEELEGLTVYDDVRGFFEKAIKLIT